MMQDRWTAIDRYIDDSLLGADETLDAVLEACAAAGLPPISFIDADKAHHAEYLECSVALCRPGSLIVADNVIRGGAVVDAASEDPSVQGVRRFMTALGVDRRVAATAIQTVGNKGYDGFAAMVVTGS